MIRARELREDEVEFILTIEEEDQPIRGSFASGDDEADAKLEREIRFRLSRGDTWAWCIVTVKAVWKNWSGSDSLGACSYDDEDGFKKGGYLEQMREEALADLNRCITDTVKSLEGLLEAA